MEGFAIIHLESGVMSLDTGAVAARGEQCSVVDTDIRGQRGLTLFANFPDGLAARGVDLALQIKLNIS